LTSFIEKESMVRPMLARSRLETSATFWANSSRAVMIPSTFIWPMMARVWPSRVCLTISLISIGLLERKRSRARRTMSGSLRTLTWATASMITGTPWEV